MDDMMLCVRLSPLYPLKGRSGSYISGTKLATITPLRGLGVNKYGYKSYL